MQLPGKKSTVKMIKKDKSSFILRLNSSLYDKDSVKQAFAKLKKEVGASLKEGEYFTIRINKSKDAEKQAYEFLNYVLKLMKNKGVA